MDNVGRSRYGKVNETNGVRGHRVRIRFFVLQRSSMKMVITFIQRNRNVSSSELADSSFLPETLASESGPTFFEEKRKL